MIYTAESRALALAEILVHLESSGPLSRYVAFRVDFEESIATDVVSDDLPKNWRADPPPRRLQSIGDGWLNSQASAVLRVPSAVVMGEFNYLINPLHPDFPRLQIAGPEKFPIDKRLVK